MKTGLKTLFFVLLAEAKRRRAETLVGIQSKSASGFSLKKFGFRSVFGAEILKKPPFN